MKDNEKLQIQVTDEEMKMIEQAKKEYFSMLERMTKDDRLKFFRENYCGEQKLNFEKEIKRYYLSS